MFKLVVLCVLLTVVAAKPSSLVASGITTYSTVLAPSVTTFTKSASSIIHPSPIVYSAPLTYTHFIKKRSPQYLPYSYAPSTLISSSHYAAATPLLTAPLFSSPAFVPTATPLTYTAHLIKKRSAQLLVAPTTYSAATPLIASTYTATTPWVTSSLISHNPLISTPFTYSTFIKK